MPIPAAAHRTAAMKLFQPDTRKRRTLGAVFAITFAVTVLLTAFFQTQVLSGEQYALRSEENRLRPIPIAAPRGNIWDRYGEVVATSIPGYSVKLLPGSEELIRETLQDLAPFLGLAGTTVDRLMERRRQRPHDLLDVLDDATYSQVAAIEERRAAFPNLIIVDRPKRYYPAGTAVGHIVGYVSEISRQELEIPVFQEAGYRQGRLIGKAGIERQYELSLGGDDGARFVEVDAMGRIVNPRSTVGALPPESGEDLRLTLDVELQRYIHSIFPDTMKGAVVAMIPSTGEVLALYSHPNYDPNAFIGGIPPGLWRALNEDEANPLLDRTIAALYPPASTWKLATAAAGLERGLVQGNTRMPLACRGGMAFEGRYARCWNPRGHGSLDLRGAIQHSCNVYFYQLGIRLGLRNLLDAGTRMGFNSRSGIDLPGEKAPIFPDGVDWYREHFRYNPPANEVMSVAIGQGPNSQSVLRLAHFYSAIAGNGSAPEPHLVVRPGAGEGSGAIRMELSEEALRALWEGLALVMAPGGTGYMASLERWATYGKTGTAQNPHGESHGWFAGFAGPRGEPPEIVVVAIVEHGASGSATAPLATKTMNFYLDRKYGLPFDPQPTMFERLQSGRARFGG
ncbi:penicillin-binding protein 2 [soil metagenome]